MIDVEFIILTYFKSCSRYDFMLVSCSNVNKRSLRSDKMLYDETLKYTESLKKSYGYGFTLIIEGGDPIPSYIVGNPQIEIDHDERDRVFFEDENTFYNSLEDQ